MADDATTGLLVSIEARTAQFEKALLRIEKQSAKGFAAVKKSADDNMRAVERTLDRANAFEKRMSAIDRSFVGFGKSLLPSLGAITAALSVREVAAFADAWTSAKNSLAVAGITGREQAKVLDQLYDSAQRNAAPLGAMADLFGKAAQASDNLGASNADLVKFSDGVGVALKVAGTSATAASGALTQLGQLLGQTRVSAEEFNSVNEGARPILMAVAAGLDAAGGSVSKLKQLVNDGEVSGRQFFEAFLRGLPQIEAMAANSTQTIEQGVTKITNAFTKYIGQTDESLGASQRLVAGLNALADNFDQTADTVLQLASVIAGALVGRSIASMLATIPSMANAVMGLAAAHRAGALAASLYWRALLGPLGVVAGAAAAAAYAYGDLTSSVDDSTRALAEQAASSDEIQGLVDGLAAAQKAYESAIASTAGTQSSASASIIASTKAEYEAKRSLLELELKRQRAAIAVQQATLTEKSSALKTEIGNQVFTRNSATERGFGDSSRDYVRLPNDLTGIEKTQAAIDASPITAEIRKIQAEMTLAELGAAKLEDALNSTFSSGSTGGSVKPGAGDDSGGGGGGKSKSKGGGSRTDDYQRLTERITEATRATIAETQAQAALNPMVDDFGYAAEKARTEQELLAAAMSAGKAITPELKAEISALAGAYAEAAAGSESLKNSQEGVRQAAADWANSAKDATKGFVTDLMEGKTAAEAFQGAMQKLADKLMDMALDGLFNVVIGGGGGGSGLLGGLLGGIGSLFGFADGGATGDNHTFIGNIEEFA
jgi:tape measure domain-containing protein